jgi:hypothetical protein
MEGASAELDRKSLKKMFPNLARELQVDEGKVRVNSIRTNGEEGEKVATSQSFDNYMPDVVDFIRRCDTEEQVEEIIRYLEKKGEIDKEYGRKLRKQLKEQGVRSFGPKKEQDYYLKHNRR